MNRRAFFGRLFTLGAVGITSQVVPAVAKVRPVEEVIRDMHEVKHTLDLWEAANPPSVYTITVSNRYSYQSKWSEEIVTEVSRKTGILFEKAMDLFPKDPTKEEVKEMFLVGRKLYEEGEIHPSHIKYYDEHNPSVLPIAAARHIFGIWKMPINAPKVHVWKPFVNRYAYLLPTM